jgi:hypothetical protein
LAGIIKIAKGFALTSRVSQGAILPIQKENAMLKTTFTAMALTTALLTGCAAPQTGTGYYVQTMPPAAAAPALLPCPGYATPFSMTLYAMGQAGCIPQPAPAQPPSYSCMSLGDGMSTCSPM